MGSILREWLIQGCINLSGINEEERISQKLRTLLSEMYGEKKISIRSWPQQGFKDTYWWYEKAKIASTVASYFIKVDNQRGVNLYAGVSVERGYEDRAKAKKKADQKKENIKRWLLTPEWDWHRFLSSFDQFKIIVSEAAERLKREIYISAEFHDKGKYDSQYFLVKDNNLYWRGGFKAIGWEKLHKFISKPRPNLWGNFYAARAFSIEECTPQLEAEKILEVFQAMRPIRDLWRGSSTF